MTTRKLLTLVSLALLLVVTLGAAAYLVKTLPDATATHQGGSSVYQAVATDTPLPTNTPIPAPPGWRQPVTNFLQSVAFAPSAPQIGYGCGVSPAQSVFYVTQNGGKSWQNFTGPEPQLDANFSNAVCTVAINPYDAQEIAVEYAACSGRYCGPVDISWTLSRSFDGGQSWKPAHLPAGNGAKGFSHALAWTSDGLFFSGFINDQGYPLNMIAASNHGGAFTWVAGQPMSSDTQYAHPPVLALFGMGTTLYAGVSIEGSFPSTLPYPAEFVDVSQDHGATWAYAQSFTGSSPMSFEQVTPNGKTLVAYNNGVLERSDDGVNWTTSPPLPDPTRLVLDDDFIVATPDGGFIVELAANNGPDTATPIITPNQVYMVSPGDSAWRRVVDLVDPNKYWNLQPATVSLDGQGRPVAIWADMGAGLGVPFQYTAVYQLP